VTEVATIVYLTVSGASLTIQSIALVRIMHTAGVSRPRRGLLRTACCRVVAALAYVTLGVMALSGTPGTGTIALIALIIIQVIWQVNAMLDTRLARALERGGDQ